MRPVSMTSLRPANVFSTCCIIALVPGKAVGDNKTRGLQPLRPRGHARDELVPEPQFLDDLPVSVDIRTLQVVEQPTTFSDHLEESTTAVVVLLVGAEVVGQIIDSLSEQRDLNSS